MPDRDRPRTAVAVRSPDGAREGRERRLAELHNQLTSGIRSLTGSKEWTDWLHVAGRFHSYSLNNTLLIYAQRPDATQVAGYQTWRQLGRQVNKGERGIRILAPIVHRRSPGENEVDDTSDQTDNDRAAADRNDGRRRLAGFRAATVFDVSQTKGDPLSEGARPELVVGEAPDRLWDLLAHEVTDRGFTVSRGPCEGRNGYTDFLDRVVVVRDDVDDAQAVKTLVHELGHVLLHGPDRSAARDTRECRGVAEVEAESVAFLVAAGRGLDVSGYTFPYVARWASAAGGLASDQVLVVVQQTAHRSLTTAHQVLDRLDRADSQADTDAVRVAARRDLADKARVGQGRTSPFGGRRAAVLVGANVPGTVAGSSAVRASEPEVARTMAANEAAATFWAARLARNSDAQQYLHERAVGHALDRDSPWHVGYAEDSWTALTGNLRDAGFTDAQLLDAGLALRSRRGTVVDRFRGRIMFPIRELDGAVVGFIGRVMPDAPAAVPKYLNTPATSVFVKGELLYGLAEQAAQLRLGRAILVEGPLDVLAMDGLQPETAAVAPCGTALTARQVQLLVQHAPRVAVALDGDAAGNAAVARAFELLRTRYGDPEWIPLPDGADPAALRLSAPDELIGLLQAVPRPLADAVVDQALAAHDLAEPQQVVVATRHAAHAIAGLPHEQVARQVGRAASALELDPEALTQAVIAAATRADSVVRQGIRGDAPTIVQAEAPAKVLSVRRATSRLPSPTNASTVATRGTPTAARMTVHLRARRG